MKKWPIITAGVVLVGILSITPWAYASMKSGKGFSGAVKQAESFLSGKQGDTTASAFTFSTETASSTSAQGNSTANQPYEPPPQPGGMVKLVDMRTISLSVVGKHKVGLVPTFTDNLGGQYKYGGIEVLNSMYDPETYDARYYVGQQFTRLTGYLVPNDWFDKKPYDSNIGRLEVYGDGKLLYKSPEIASDAIKRTRVDVNLSNVSIVRIVLTAGDGKSDGYLGFVNAVFEK